MPWATSRRLLQHTLSTLSQKNARRQSFDAVFHRCISHFWDDRKVARGGNAKRSKKDYAFVPPSSSIDDVHHFELWWALFTFRKCGKTKPKSSPCGRSRDSNYPMLCEEKKSLGLIFGLNQKRMGLDSIYMWSFYVVFGLNRLWVRSSYGLWVQWVRRSHA